MEGEIAAKFLAAVLAQPKVKRLLSTDYFSVDGTLIEAWASMKRFKPKAKDGDDQCGRDVYQPAARRQEIRHSSTYSSNRLDIGIKLKGVSTDERFEPAGSWNAMVTHRVRIQEPTQIDREVFPG